MKLSGNWLTRAETQAVCEMLTNGGYQALLVGGAVRNALLDLPVAEVDVATDALPDQVLALGAKTGLKTAPTGIAHGTVTVIANGIPYEITTFRRDVQTNGRHAKVSFDATLAQDAARRDFTMNALYARPDGTLIDPLGGLHDLLARRVRFVGDPSDRITEDFLRILRFFRFHALYGDPQLGLDAEGLAACAALSAGTDTLSRERVGAEFRKLLAARDPSPAVAAMAAAGILARIIPGADPIALAPLVHIEEDTPPDWLRRLAVLGGTGQSWSLRLSRTESRSLSLLRDQIATTAGARELGYRFGAGTAQTILQVRAALAVHPMPPLWQSELAAGSNARFPVKSADLIARFQGPALGQRLAALKASWIASGFTLTRADLLAMA